MAQKHTHCKECSAKLRPKGRTLDEFPDTKAHSANGLCTGCYTSERRSRTPLTNPNPTHVREYLHYIHNRRQRGIPKQGTQP